MSEVKADERVLRLERLIPAPPEKIFALWTEPELMAKWWGPDGYELARQELDVRAGGRWRTSMRSPEGKLVTMSGIYRSIEAPRRLVFSWAWEDEAGNRGHETEVTVTLAAAPGGTRLVLVQQLFENRESRDGHDRGWSSTLDRLARAAA
jgi:uncharacterized protein YndB with AHSA1/START domain